MTQALFLIAFIAAACVQVWIRLKARTRAAIITKAKALLDRFNQAQRALSAKLFRRRTAYRSALMNDAGQLTPAGKIIVAHLTKFCYAFATTAQGEASAEALMRREGRRQVWIEVMRELNLDPAQALDVVKEEDLLAA